jgi:hypothetical protein
MDDRDVDEGVREGGGDLQIWALLGEMLQRLIITLGLRPSC